MGKLRILIVDDHRIVREGLRMALEVEQDIEVVGEAGEGSEAVRLAMELSPDLVLMDVMMPGMNGIDACQEIRNLQSNTKVLMLTASDDSESVSASLVAGAQGYFLKIGSGEELIKAVRAVGSGHSILDPKITRTVTERFARLVNQEREREVDQLTPRELDVLLQVAQGSTNREVGEKLVISEYTARNTVGNILGKLGLKNRSELVRWSYQHDLMGRVEPENSS